MKTLKRIAASTAAAAMLAIFATPFAATAANTGTYNADCIDLGGDEELFYAAAGDTVTLNLTNCAGFEKRDQDYQVVDSGATSSSMLLEPGFMYEFRSDNNVGFTAEVGFIKPESEPAGELLISTDIVMPASPKEFRLPSSNEDDEYNLDGNEDCNLESEDTRKHIYTTQRIKVAVAGVYTFRNVGTNPIGGYMRGGSYHPFEDTFLALYTSFNPSRVDDNVVGCNDDLNDLFTYDNEMFYEDLGEGVTMEGHQPYFTATLTPGYYTLVLATWDEVSAAQWRAGNVGGDTFTRGSASASFQMWGPTGGLELAAPEVLANTGGESSMIPLALASLLMAAGSVFVVTSMRRKARR